MNPVFSNSIPAEAVHQSMFNMPVVKQLVYKDLRLMRKLIATYIGGTIFSLSILSLGEWQFFMGAVIFISMIVGLGNHQISNTLIRERKEQTLSFIMSLPVAPLDYALAKLLSTMATYVMPLMLMVAIGVLVILVTPLPDGFIPFTVLVSVLVLLNHCITWSVGMAMESEGAILIVMISLNCLLNPALYFLVRTPEISQHINSAEIVWAGLPIKILLLEIVCILLVLGVSFYVHARKKVFY